MSSDDYYNRIYTTLMPLNLVSRLSASDFANCGSLLGQYKTDTTVVMFYSTNCRFCQEFAIQLSNFSEKYADKLNTRVAAINISTNPTIVSMSKNFPYDIKTQPSVIVYFNGKPCSSYAGYKTGRTAEDLAAFIQKINGPTQTCDFKFVPCD